jgi:hypothetical protein
MGIADDTQGIPGEGRPMPFNFATFQQHVQGRNTHFSRFKESSLQPLENLLQNLGAAVGPQSLAQIQPVWAAVPHDKQQKYVNAGNYLKQFVPGLADAIPVSSKMRFREFRVLPMTLGANQNYPARFFHVFRLFWKSSNGNLASLKNVGT